MENIKDIAFEQIEDTQYHWGCYGPFKVIIDIKTGYINATHLCALAKNKNGDKKELYIWKQSAPANELIDEVGSSLVVSRDDLLKVVTGGQITVIRGTYAHPDLIPHIASWASPKFAVMVSKIINAHLVREYKEQIRAKDQNIDELNRKVDQLLAEVRASREENCEVLNQLDTITSELESTSIANDELAEKVTEANSTINKIAAKLDIATDQRVPPAKTTICDEVFAVYRNPTTNKFYMIRRQKRTIGQGIANSKRGGYTQQVFYSDSPNAVNLGVRIKDIIPRSLGRVTGTIITLANDRKTDDLIDYIRNAEQEKKNV